MTCQAVPLQSQSMVSNQQDHDPPSRPERHSSHRPPPRAANTSRRHGPGPMPVPNANATQGPPPPPRSAHTTHNPPHRVRHHHHHDQPTRHRIRHTGSTTATPGSEVMQTYLAGEGKSEEVGWGVFDVGW
ncbi:unnamed protein product [Pleuronectes platessa]|uniref:Uncharacterized protein n=1 Tax=Pleuronectes platessa TaxID=8262 RepID=A0A9N7TZP9_PLEPL|nr:unnamed protein product [Pleuronectes platessa]